jgi:hypothetical protein
VEDATYNDFHCLNSQGTQQWTLFHETSCDFLKSLKPLLFLVEEILIIVCWKVGLEMRLQLPSWYRLFGTLWTTVMHNPSCTQWHFDPGDFRMVALLYFGDFIDGELELGAPFCKTVPIKNGDLVWERFPVLV